MKGKIFIGRIYDTIFSEIIKIFLIILPVFADFRLTIGYFNGIIKKTGIKNTT